MELRKEYEETIDAGIAAFAANGVMSDALKVAVERCQQLADRPPRELTDAEIAVHSRTFARGDYTDYDFARAIEAAAHAKQREPQVVKFRAARNTSTEVVHMFPADDAPNGCWEWLEPAQEFEVRI